MKISAGTPEEEFREEVRAWNIGRNLLKKCGFSEWQTFNVLREESLSTYRGLPLSEHEFRRIECEFVGTEWPAPSDILNYVDCGG